MIPRRRSNEEPSQSAPTGETRRYVGVKFNCCGVYLRIYINKDGTAYEGRCPKCFKPIKLKVGSGGTDHRFFEAF